MIIDEHVMRDDLHRHLQVFAGQLFDHEMVKQLMSFVLDIEKNHPNISWLAKDSHIRLLNSIFKKIGQMVDDKSIAAIEDSICSSLVFHMQPDKSGAGKLARPSGDTTRQGDAQTPAQKAKPNDPAAKLLTDSKEKASPPSGNENGWQRMLQEISVLENRLTRTVEVSSSEIRETEKRIYQELVEREIRFAIERSEMEAKLAKERTEAFDSIQQFLTSQQAQESKLEGRLDARAQGLESGMESMFKSYALKVEDSAGKARQSLEDHSKAMSQKLLEIETKVAAARKGQRRMTILSVIGFIAMAAGFAALLYFK